MYKNILKESILDMSEDVNIVRITFLTSFFHSLIVSFLIILNVNTLLSKNFENGLYIWKIAEFFVQAINKNQVVSYFLVITLTLFLLYSIIYPVWQSAIIHYLHDRTISIKESLSRGRDDFFSMFEYWALSLIFSPIVLITTAFKLIVLNWSTSKSLIICLVIWFIIMSTVNMLKSYTRYCIVIEGYSLYEALSYSFKLSFKNLKNTSRYVRNQTVLLVLFSLNFLLILWIPILMIYLFINLNIIHLPFFKFLVYFIFLLLILAWSYMSSIVRAFFAYYRHKIYKTLEK